MWCGVVFQSLQSIFALCLVRDRDLFLWNPSLGSKAWGRVLGQWPSAQHNAMAQKGRSAIKLLTQPANQEENPPRQDTLLPQLKI